MLTERELNVLEYLVKGFKNDQISDKLHISVHTTKAHLESIYEKFGVTNRVQAAIKAVALGIVDIRSVIKNF